jgi:uncharacterized protein
MVSSETQDAEVRRLLSMIAGAIVDRPDELTIATEEDRGGVVFVIRAHPSDIGKVIGQHGRTAHSIRTIVAAVGSKECRRYDVVIDDGAGVESGSQTECGATNDPT